MKKTINAAIAIVLLYLVYNQIGDIIEFGQEGFRVYSSIAFKVFLIVFNIVSFLWKEDKLAKGREDIEEVLG